jgi:hypothetical protein
MSPEDLCAGACGHMIQLDVAGAHLPRLCSCVHVQGTCSRHMHQHGCTHQHWPVVAPTFLVSSQTADDVVDGADVKGPR